MHKLEKEKAAMRAKYELDQKNERDQKQTARKNADEEAARKAALNQSKEKAKKDTKYGQLAEDDGYSSEYTPDYRLRNFNEIDVLGDFARDKKGNLQFELPEGEKYGTDLKGRKVTTNGYLVDKNGNIVD